MYMLAHVYFLALNGQRKHKLFCEKIEYQRNLVINKLYIQIKLGNNEAKFGVWMLHLHLMGHHPQRELYRIVFFLPDQINLLACLPPDHQDQKFLSLDL